MRFEAYEGYRTKKTFSKSASSKGVTYQVRYGDIVVSYRPHLEGGGTSFQCDFPYLVSQLFGKVERICEFGAGAGFIGFSLLASGLCNKLCLIDISPEAIEICRQTVEENGLADRVSLYLSDGLSKVPDSERWNLVVGNPPHFKGTKEQHLRDLRSIDPDWNIHRKFYNDAPRFLIRGGSILFIENLLGSSPKLWRRIIDDAGLQFRACFRKKSRFSFHLNTILGSFKPKWAAARVLTGRYSVLPDRRAIFNSFYFVWSSKVRDP